jgi:RNA polymerase sigma-54 factor
LEAAPKSVSPIAANEPLPEDMGLENAESFEEPEFLLRSYVENHEADPASSEIPAAVSHNGTGASISRAQVASVKPSIDAPFTIEQLHAGIEIVRQMDPIGVAARDLRECLLLQLRDLERQVNNRVLNGDSEVQNQNLAQIQAAMSIIDTQLRNVQNRQYKDISRAIGRPLDTVMQALDFLRTLDPKPGQRYNQVEPRLIEPDVAFVKQSDEYVVMMNEDDIPVLRLNPGYKKLLNREAAEKDVRNYVKERYKSAIQLMKNIEQRKQTILKTCYAIIGRQREFLDYGIDHLKPMMIKEVAEEIGVHPSTVSRAVANKYVHTSQGVYELRYFFSESVNGPEGGGTSLMILKRRVKKLIDEEDARRPLTDEQITRILQSQGINVTRRTVAKYREDMKIPSTHQRRVKD